ncbi:MAG TPA: DNA primase [Bacilli bacterium]
MRDGRLPDDLIAAVLKRHDIVETVRKYLQLTKAGKYFKGLCPFHSEKTPSFTVSPDKQIFHCFGCGKTGSVVTFIMEVEGLSFAEAVRHLAAEAGIATDWAPLAATETKEQREQRAIIEGHELSAHWYHYLLKNAKIARAALHYLRDRGFTDKMIDEFQLGYSPPMRDKLYSMLQSKEKDLRLMEKGGLLTPIEGGGYADRFRDRIMFPIRNAQGQTIAFAGRVLNPEVQPKYLNSPETPLFNKSRTLFNLDKAKNAMRKSQTSVLFEGYADVMKAWAAGVENGVATMGTALTEYHVKLLKRYVQTVIVCYDGDDAGQAAAYKSIPLLQAAGLETLIAVIPGKMDPDEYITVNGGERFKSAIIESAVPAIKFKLIYLRRNHILQEDTGKLKYIDSALRAIAELKSPTEREFYVKELSAEFQFSVASLTEQLHQIRQELQKNAAIRDKEEKPWNNVMNDGKSGKSAPPLLPAYHVAERNLLYAMMTDRDVCLYVQEHLGGQFNVEEYAALAAYLYAFYGENPEPDISKFITMLADEQLAQVAAAIAALEAVDVRPIDEYIKEIRKVPVLQQLKAKEEMALTASRTGNSIEAARIFNEIVLLKRELDS